MELKKHAADKGKANKNLNCPQSEATILLTHSHYTLPFMRKHSQATQFSFFWSRIKGKTKPKRKPARDQKKGSESSFAALISTYCGRTFKKLEGKRKRNPTSYHYSHTEIKQKTKRKNEHFLRVSYNDFEVRESWKGLVGLQSLMNLSAFFSTKGKTQSDH